MFLKYFLLAWGILLSGLAGPIVFNFSPILILPYWVGCIIGGYAVGKQLRS